MVKEITDRICDTFNRGLPMRESQYMTQSQFVPQSQLVPQSEPTAQRESTVQSEPMTRPFLPPLSPEVQQQVNEVRAFNQADIDHKIQLEKIDLDKKCAYEQAKADISLKAEERKQLLREADRERRKSQYEILGIRDGMITVHTENLGIDSPERQVTNITFPKLTLLRRISDETCVIYRINFRINEKEKRVYLDKNSSGRASYIIRKLLSEGAKFLSSGRKAEGYAEQFLAALLNNEYREEFIADQPGWVKEPNGDWRYVEKGEQTWEILKKLAR